MDGVKEAEFILQDAPVRLRITEDVERLRVAGLTLDGLTKGEEVEVPYWVAEELMKTGKGELLEERFNLKDLAKAHWREALPSSRHLANIGEGFYFNLRRFLSRLRDESVKDSDKERDLEKAHSMAMDIINCRVRKLASLAASQIERDEITKNLTLEERKLFESLKAAVEDWRREILEEDTLGESARES